MSTLVVVQARAGSTRLPGKVLMPVGGRPMLAFMLARLEPVRCDELVVATSTDRRDDAVADVAAAAGVPVVRGSESDVLGRFVAALDAHPADVVVRLTGDCPLIDPAVVNEAIALRATTGADYASNTLVRTYPDGLDVEVLRADALRAAAAEAVDPVEREHVTPFVYRRPERFRLAAVVGPESLGELRWTVDTAEDLDRIRGIVAALADPLTAGWREIVAVTGLPAAGGLSLRPVPPPDDTDFVRSWVAEEDGQPIGWARVAVRSGVGRLTRQVDPAHDDAVVELVRRALAADFQVQELHIDESITQGSRNG